jgi:hypothetical protein
MPEFSIKVSRSAGCLDQVASALAGVRIESAACACAADREGIATFSLPDESTETKQALQRVKPEETRSSVLHIKVPNEAGCLSRVTSVLSEAGVTIASLACACAAGDDSGIVSVGLHPRG